MAVPLGRGPKLNTLAEEDNEALDKARREWLRRLEAPRGKASGSMPHAVWDPERCAAKVTRTKGRDLSLLGYPEKGEMLKFKRLESLHHHPMILYLDFETSSQKLNQVMILKFFEADFF